MKIALVSAWDQNMQAVVDLTLPNILDYCTQHKYGCLHTTKWEDKERNRRPIWARIKLAKEVLPNWDWLCITDIDLLIMNKSIKLESFLETSADLITSCDTNGLNTGVVFLRNSFWAKNFLNYWYENGYKWPVDMQEQISLACLLYKEPKEKWQIEPQRKFNSFLYNLVPMNYPEGQYQPGDFIIHLAGMENWKRVNILKSILAQDGVVPLCNI